MLNFFLVALLLFASRYSHAGENLSRESFQGVRVDIKDVFEVPHTDLSRLLLKVRAPVRALVWVDRQIDVYPPNAEPDIENIRALKVVTPHRRFLRAGEAFQIAYVTAEVPNEPVTLHLWVIDAGGNKREVLVHLDMPVLARLEAGRVINRYRGLNVEVLAGSSLDSVFGHQDSNQGFSSSNSTSAGGLPQYQIRLRYGWRPKYYFLAEYFGRQSGSTISSGAPDQRTQSDFTLGIGRNLSPRDEVFFNRPFRVIPQVYMALDYEDLPLFDYTSSSTSTLVNLHNLYARVGAEYTFDSERQWFFRTHFQFGYLISSSPFQPNFAFLTGARFMYGRMFTRNWYWGVEADAFYRELDGRYLNSNFAYNYVSGAGLLVLGIHPLGIKTRL